MSNIKKFDEIITSLEGFEIRCIEEVISVLNVMFEIDDKLRIIDKYTLLKYLTDKSESNLQDKHSFWNIYSNFMMSKDHIINTILQNY